MTLIMWISPPNTRQELQAQCDILARHPGQA